MNSNTHPTAFFQKFWECILSGKTWRGEICNRAKDKSLYWVDSVVAPLPAENDEERLFFSIRWDITEQKQLHRDALHAKALLDRSEELSGVGTWELDLQTNELYWSNETLRIHGLEQGQTPSLDEAINYYAPEARPIVLSAVNQAMVDGSTWDFELPLITQSGERIWVRAVGSPEFEQEKPRLLYGAFQDITERKAREEELLSVFQRMKLATSSGQIGIWEYNLKTGVLSWDETMYKIYGLSPSEGNEAYELWASHLHPDDRPQAEKAVAAAINNLQDFDTEFRIIKRDGSISHLRGRAHVNRTEDGTPTNMMGVNWDVSEHRKLEETLSKQKELLHVTLESIGDAVIATDLNQRVVFLNYMAELMTGWSNQDAQNQALCDVFRLVDTKTAKPISIKVPDESNSDNRLYTKINATLTSQTNQTFEVESALSVIKDKSLNTFGYVLTARDITEQQRLASEVSYRATHDDLTGLFNRAEFDVALNKLLKNIKNNRQTQHAILYIDLDKFKIVNDSCGHVAGDALLQSIGQLLSNTVRKNDFLARLGGDEFGVIMENCSTEQALRLATEICESMDNYRFNYKGNTFRVSASIGLAPIDSAIFSETELLQAADTAMYAAKNAGRNRVHVWSADDTETLKNKGELYWVDQIHRALDEDRFQLFAQRLVNVKQTTEALHFEVLLRMTGEDGEIISPFMFFPAAEHYHLANRIDRWVLTKSIQWLEEKSQTQDIERICINLSGQSVNDIDFHSYVAQLLQQLSPELRAKICLEITETVAVTNLQSASDFVDEIKKLGSTIALDDFGAGSSSFGYIKNLSADVLKIDGQFIKNLIDEPLDNAAVRCFVDVAKILNLETVAEFVDSPKILEQVKALGIDYAQGFLLHKPEPIDKIIK